MRKAILLISMLLTSSPLFAQDDAKRPISFKSQGVVEIKDVKVKYEAEFGETLVSDLKGNPVASIFSTSYRAVNGGKQRPVVFAFSGGPGFSTALLHIGILGPKRVVVPSDAEDDGAAPYRIINNNYSLLDVADVVLVDPVGTGYSRAVNGHDDKEFWGIGQDAELLANFVRQWLSKYERWNSPKYLLGSSYGSTRAAAMTRALSSGEFGSVALNGCIMISAAFDFQGLRPMAHNGMVSVIYLPTFTAIAWYHGKIANEPDLEALLDKARAFALGPIFRGFTRAGDSRRRSGASYRAICRSSQGYRRNTWNRPICTFTRFVLRKNSCVRRRSP